MSIKSSGFVRSLIGRRALFQLHRPFPHAGNDQMLVARSDASFAIARFRFLIV